MPGRPTLVSRNAVAPWCIAVLLLGGCDALLTQAPDPGDVMDGAVDGLTAGERAAFAIGDAEFERPFAASEGLGPIFNNVSCASCHSGDGRGRPENGLTRFSMGGLPAPELGGPQVQDRAIPGATPEVAPAGADLSRRMPPAVFGMGFVEAIPDSSILGRADPNDGDGDGISGRPNLVTAPDFIPAHEPGGGPGPRIGRFGRKAQVSSLFEQVVTAYHQDMGITSDALPIENENPLAGSGAASADRVADPELPGTTVRNVVNYVRMLAAPAPGVETTERAHGRVVFDQIGCTGCHTPVQRTGSSPVAALSYREFTPYSDFLLHDMGDALADLRPDGAADGYEWRTAPLWGLRVAREFLRGQLFLMHDGRATSVDEAVRLHGGEAAAARDAYLALPANQRAAVLDFVESR
jgi:CxxC motif-containing protein (DUF1111 family)